VYRATIEWVPVLKDEFVYVAVPLEEGAEVWALAPSTRNSILPVAPLAGLRVAVNEPLEAELRTRDVGVRDVATYPGHTVARLYPSTEPSPVTWS
jgi:hypothetical protein